MSALSANGTQVFGISVQDADSHKRFVKEYNLNFPLLVDSGRNLSLLLGATDNPNGTSSRITVIVDKEGTISKIYKGVNAKNHGKALIEFFKAM